MAAWGAPDSQRGSADGSRSSISSHIPSGMTGLPSILQGMWLPPAACAPALKLRRTVIHESQAVWPQDLQASSAMQISSVALQHRFHRVTMCLAKPMTWM